MDKKTAKVKKKMTKEQIQLAILKKKECDSKALIIVEQLLEPEVDPEWLVKNLVHINKCHMEDVIEERAITKLCGYVLCQKSLTNIINQHYHISLKSKKVYDVTKRKNFCSSSCFGASNYLLEQLLTSPLWLRNEEEIPKFRIFCKNNGTSSVLHGEELDIKFFDHCLEDGMQNIRDSNLKKEYFNNANQTSKTQSEISNEKKLCKNNEHFVLENFKNINDDKMDSKEKNYKFQSDAVEVKKELKINIQLIDNNFVEKTKKSIVCIEYNHDKIDIVEQQIKKNKANKINCESPIKQNMNLQNTSNCKNVEKLINSNYINLAARIEKSFQEWITKETIDFLFGDDATKQKVIENIERQNKYSILCKKLNKLQFKNEQEDSKILKPILKPAPHFTQLKEEGEKLDLKVQAFYKGATTIEKNQLSIVNKQESHSETFLPLTDIQAPHIHRRKIFLDKLDQILPEILRTLAGNNDVYTRSTCNYTSVRCTAVKALIHTFSLSAKNIIFKTIEWTLVGLVIIKMLSLLDPWLANLLSLQQANMYTSMILTSYRLDPHYLDFLVTSFNPNMNPK